MRLPNVLSAAVVVTLLAGPVSAGVIAVDYTAPGSTSIYSQNFTHGWEFTAVGDLTVDGLAMYDFQSNGLTASHVVTLWTIAGSPLASISILPGSYPLTGGYAIFPITPVNLTSGSSYVMSTYMTGANEAMRYIIHGPLITDPRVVVNSAVRRFISGNAFPSSTAGSFQVMVGPTFTVTPQAIPEPSTLTLIGIGGIGLCVLAARRRRRVRRTG